MTPPVSAAAVAVPHITEQFGRHAFGDALDQELPQAVLKTLKRDMHRTLQQFAGRDVVPGSELANVDSKANRAALERVVRAVVASTSGEYCQGQNLLAAATLVASNIDEASAFAVTHWLLVATGLHSLYTASTPTLDMFVECFRVYLQRFAPAVESSLNAKMAVSGFPKWMVIEWVTAMFSTVMPLPQVMCIVDLLAASRTSYPAFTSPDTAHSSPESATGAAGVAAAARTPVLSAGSGASRHPSHARPSIVPPSRRGTMSNTFKLRNNTLKGMVSPRVSNPSQHSSAHATPVRVHRAPPVASSRGSPGGVSTPTPVDTVQLPMSASSAASAASRSTFYISTPPPTVGSALRASMHDAAAMSPPQTPTRSTPTTPTRSTAAAVAQGPASASKWWVPSKALALPGRIVSTFTTPQRPAVGARSRPASSRASSAPALHAMDNILYRVCAGILLELAANHGLMEWDEDDFMLQLKPSIAAANFNSILARAAELPPCEVEVLDTLITGSYAALPFDFHIGVEVVNFKTNPSEARSRVAGLLRSPKPVYRVHSRDGRRLKRGGVDGPHGMLHTPAGLSHLSSTPLGEAGSRRPADDSILSSRSVRRARKARHSSPDGSDHAQPAAGGGSAPSSPSLSARSFTSAEEPCVTAGGAHAKPTAAFAPDGVGSDAPLHPAASRASTHLRFSSVLSASSDTGIADVQLSSSVPDTVSPLRAGLVHVSTHGRVASRGTPLVSRTPARDTLPDSELARHFSLEGLHASAAGSHMQRGYASSTDSEDALAFDEWYALGSSVADWKPLTLSGGSSAASGTAPAAASHGHSNSQSDMRQAAAVASAQEAVPPGIFSWHVSSGAALRLEWMDVRRDGSRIKALRLPGGLLAVPTRPLRPQHLSLQASIPDAQVMDGVGMYFVTVQVLVAASCLRVVGASGATPTASDATPGGFPVPSTSGMVRRHSSKDVKVAVRGDAGEGGHPAGAASSTLVQGAPDTDLHEGKPAEVSIGLPSQPVDTLPARKESHLAPLPVDAAGLVVVTQKTILHRYSEFVDLLQQLQDGATNKAGGSTLAAEGANEDSSSAPAGDVLSKAHWLWFTPHVLGGDSPASPQRSRVPASLTAELRSASMWRPPPLPEQLVAAFPPKRWFFNTDVAVLQERRLALQQWLQGVTAASAPAQPALVKGFAGARSETSGARSSAKTPTSAALSTPPPAHASRVGLGVSPGALPPLCRFALHPSLVDFLRVETDLLTLLKS